MLSPSSSPLLRRIVDITVVMPALLATICCSPRGPEEQGPVGEQLVGYWETEPWLSQLGMALERLCIRKDGSYARVLHSQGATLPSSGQYKVESGNIEFASATGTERQRFALREGHLVMAVDDSVLTELTYVKVAAMCPEGISVPPAWEAIWQSQ